ncbi:unnamed protein product [Lymnaea stagnalis]|uniref:Fucosyltransferase n=1 Tax=Lymnaea stagnalis TaxID=6523 RepID=A0AAV2HTB8_LYMST
MLTKKSLLLGLGVFCITAVILEEVHQMSVHRSGKDDPVSAYVGDSFAHNEVNDPTRHGAADDKVRLLDNGHQVVNRNAKNEVGGGGDGAQQEDLTDNVTNGARVDVKVTGERGQGGGREGSGSSERTFDTKAEVSNDATPAEPQLLDSRSAADDGGYDDSFEKERERLRRSPYIYDEEREKERMSMIRAQRTVKKISGFLPHDTGFNRKSFQRCPYDKCQVVDSMAQADAVLFRASAIRTYRLPSHSRPPGQRWVMFTSDPAIKNYAFDRKDVGSNFNWTITYQQDSDFPNPFGKLQRRKLPDKDYDAIYEGKVNNTAWFVSHCETWSRREVYVDRMQKILPVDIFGGCSDRRCGVIHYRTSDGSLCLPMLTKQYKFYLAFENSFCKDYLTEKFFKLFQDVDVIPVVRGGFDYKRYLPSGIFVDAADFKGPEALAKYLLRLGNDKIEYVKMLKRKDRWMTIYGEGLLCKVCEALHTAGDKKGFIPDLVKKFNGDPSYCWTPADLGDP